MTVEQRFPLASMSGLIFWLTLVVLPLPLVFLFIGSGVGGALGLGTDLLLLPGALIALVYATVWFYMRPSYFQVAPDALTVVWPMRRFTIPRSEILSVERLSGAEFREQYGFGYRIGAGGLWGGFGLFKCSQETFRFYISRQDDYVIVRSRVERPLLITPADPDHFVRALAS